MRHLLFALLLVASYFALFFYSGDCVDFYLLGYSGRGTLIPAKICKIPQAGAYVEGGVAGTELGESVRVAYEVFNRRHGPLPFGVVVKVEGPVEFVDGRSADLALYSALFALVNNSRPVLATGKIADDGYTVDSVLFVSQKLQAVGKGPVLIPYPNRLDIVPTEGVIPVKNLDEVDAALSSLR